MNSHGTVVCSQEKVGKGPILLERDMHVDSQVFPEVSACPPLSHSQQLKLSLASTTICLTKDGVGSFSETTLRNSKNTSHSRAHMSDKCRQQCGDKHMANMLGIDCINC
jgi:hypothetical protein